MTRIVATYIDHMGDDLRTSNSARVSFKKKRDEFLFEGDPRVRSSGRSDEKLIYDLAEEGHIAPFGHSYLLFHIKAPIFVARQLVKHKFLRWSEVSRRYVNDDPEFYVPDVWRGKPSDKKQGSEGEIPLEYLDAYRGTHIEDDWPKIGPKWGLDEYKDYRPEYSLAEEVTDRFQDTLEHYKLLLKVGVAPEQARMVLPQNTMTEWYWSGSLDAFASMCNLRLKDDTQYESRLVAQQISAVVKELFPVSWKALVSEP